MMGGNHAPSAGRGASLAAVASTTGAMPVFIIGAIAVLLRDDLGFHQRDIGLAVSAFFAGGAATSALGGRIVDRAGPWRILRATTLVGGAAMAAMALAVQTLPTLLVCSLAAGASNGLTQPASNAALAGATYRRPALTFGVKQASVPLATLLAGVSVPTIAVHLGWRGALLVAALLPLTASLAMPRRIPRPSAPPPVRHDRATSRWRPSLALLVLAGGVGAGTAAATSFGAYIAEGATAAGLPVDATGWLIAACGLVGILARVVVGWLSDAPDRSILNRVAAMLALGAPGYLLLAVDTPAAFGVGALVIYGLGWGWAGALMFSVVRLHPETPAAATGIVGAGAAVGASVGPTVAGHAIESLSFPTVWTALGIVAGLASVLVVTARRRFLVQLAAAGTPRLNGASGSAS